MLSDTLFPNHTMMAYHKGNKYCERISSAITDMHNAQYVQQKQYKSVIIIIKTQQIIAIIIIITQVSVQKHKNHNAN